MRGVAVRFRDEPDHVPIGLLYEATVVRPAENGQMLRLEDLDLPDRPRARLGRTARPIRSRRVGPCPGHDFSAG